jgi:hypothetical protein
MLDARIHTVFIHIVRHANSRYMQSYFHDSAALFVGVRPARPQFEPEDFELFIDRLLWRLSDRSRWSLIGRNAKSVRPSECPVFSSVTRNLTFSCSRELHKDRCSFVLERSGLRVRLICIANGRG